MPKLVWLDTGLVNYAAQVQKEVLGAKDIMDAWRGMIAEQIVAQELLTLTDKVSQKRCFWVRNKSGSNAEVDYVWVQDSIEQTIKENQKEYVLSLQLLDTIEEQLNVHIELEEASLITMFICEKNQAIEDDGFPVFLIAMHGSQTASSLVDVVKTLVKTDKVYAFNLSLDKEIIDAYNELKNFIKQINMGKGILMMYDMGSLKTMAQEIADETGINIQFIISPTTLIALECARKMETIHDLDSIVLSMKDSYEKYFPSIVDNYKREIKKDIIITLCMTGEGGALQIKRYLEKIIEFRDIDIIPLSMKDKKIGRASCRERVY